MKAIHIIVTSLTLTLMLATSLLHAVYDPNNPRSFTEIHNTTISAVFVTDNKVLFKVKNQNNVPTACISSLSDVNHMEGWIAVPKHKNTAAMYKLLSLAELNAYTVSVLIQGKCIQQYNPLKSISIN